VELLLFAETAAQVLHLLFLERLQFMQGVVEAVQMLLAVKVLVV
jgi:hypothetical protein